MTEETTKNVSVPSTSRSLPIALLRARERVMKPIRGVLNDAGVTEQQWRVLRVMQELGPSDATEIAQAACVLMPSLTRILQMLEGQSYCSRQSHPSDRRKMVIRITDKGRELIDQNAPGTHTIFARLEEEFGPQKMNKLLDLLNELVETERK